MARRKINKEVNTSLTDKLMKLSRDVAEEFDMMELIEDEIKDLFHCDLNCVTCTHEEQGKCLQNFKKANLYWLRKIVQDEEFLKDIVDQMLEMKETIIELADALKVSLQMAKTKTDYKKKLQENKNGKRSSDYYS